MIRLPWERIKHRKLTNVIVMIAFISIFSLIPVGLEQSRISKATVQESIEKHGRGSYDLLVRPAFSRTPIEQKLGMVEDNYIGDSKGGISVDEWKTMKEDPAIEIAAPVASLGYFRGKQFTIELPALDEPTLFTYQFLTSDGKTTYPLGEKESIMYFEQDDSYQIQYFTEKQEGGNISVAMLTRTMPENYNLLVAIDPESETQLTGIDFSELNKELDEDEFIDFYESYRDNSTPFLKILQREDLTLSLYLELKVDQLDVQLEDYLNIFGLQEGEWLNYGSQESFPAAFNTLKKMKPVKTETLQIDLSNFIKPFDGIEMGLNKSFEPIPNSKAMLNLNTSTYYVASKISYQNLDTLPTVTIEKDGIPPIYKKLEQKGVSLTEAAEKSLEVPFIGYQIGTFSPLKVEENQLAASPLGIYGDMQATAEDGAILTPTISPGSFIPSPASGITDIDNAVMVKGDKPIDAIRVKVAGIASYNEDARMKIENVATNLLKLGYEVDVVAGSFFKEMTLDVEGIGLVKESWTTLALPSN